MQNQAEKIQGDGAPPPVNDLKATAIKLAKNGNAVFPLQPSAKAPIKKPKMGLKSGWKDATTDPVQVADWWNVVPSANIGMPAGKYLIIDLDVKGDEDGVSEWHALQDEHGPAPETNVVVTPSGGEHWYFKVPEGMHFKNSTRVRPGIDIRHKGGYVLMPPSEVDGVRYRYKDGPKPVAEAPYWLLSMLPRKDAEASPEERGKPLEVEDSIPKGARNRTLFRLGCSLRSKGMSEGEIRQMISVVNGARCNPSLGSREVKKIAASAANYDAGSLGIQHNNGLKSATSATVQSGIHFEEPPKWVDFPLNTLPPEVREYLCGHAKAKGITPGMMALPALAVMAAAVGNSRVARIKRSWEETATLWTAVVAPSGTRKSPALEDVVRPVERLEMDAKRDHRTAQEEYEYRMEQYESLPPGKKKMQDPPAEPDPRRRYRIGDATIEKVVRLHDQNRRSLLLVRDELAGWLGSFDRYAQGEADLQSWIEMYEGRLTQTDRVGGGTFDVERPCISVVGTTQPGVLERKLTPLHFESGFTARLMLVQPPEKEKRFNMHDVTRDVEARYISLVESLYGIPLEDEPKPLRCTRPAIESYETFYNANAKIQQSLPDCPLRRKLSKIEALPPRIALVLQLADDVDSQKIGQNAMRRAIAITEWIRYEQARIDRLYGFHEISLPDDYQKASALPEPFRNDDVQAVWGVKRRQGHNILKRLVEKGIAEDLGMHKGYRLTEMARKRLGQTSSHDFTPDFDSLPAPPSKNGQAQKPPAEAPF